MNSPFQKSFDELLDDILTDYRNQFPEADTSKGTLIFIRAACLASALWGLSREQAWIGDQIFADTADSENLAHHAWVWDIARTYGEADSALLTRLLNRIRKPPAGGNANDYEQWALKVDNVAAATCVPLGQGLGTVDVVIVANLANTGSEVASSHAISGTATSAEENKLIDSLAAFNGALPVRPGDIAVNDDTLEEAVVTSVDGAGELTLDKDIFPGGDEGYTIKSLTIQAREYIEAVRPVTASIVRVLPVQILTRDVSLTVTGSGINKAQAAAEIGAYISALKSGETLYLAQIAAIAIAAGAGNAVVNAPAADVAATPYQMIRPGVVSVA